jgi:hypothetical protein
VPRVTVGNASVAIKQFEMREEDEEKEWISSQVRFATSPVLAHNVFTASGKWGLHQVLEKGNLTVKYTLKPDDHEMNVVRQEIVAVPPSSEQMQRMAELCAQLQASTVWAETKKLLVTFPIRIDNIVFGTWSEQCTICFCVCAC